MTRDCPTILLNILSKESSGVHMHVHKHGNNNIVDPIAVMWSTQLVQNQPLVNMG